MTLSPRPQRKSTESDGSTFAAARGHGLVCDRIGCEALQLPRLPKKRTPGRMWDRPGANPDIQYDMAEKDRSRDHFAGGLAAFRRERPLLRSLFRTKPIAS